MMGKPEVEDVRRHILDSLRDSPVGASTRFSLAETLQDRYPMIERDDARSLVGRAIAVMQESNEVVVLRPEVWDLSGDERVRLTAL